MDLLDIWDPHTFEEVPEEAILKHLSEDMEADWAQILDNQPIVLNDRMMTDAVQSPHIQSEHSYSLTINEEMPHSPFGQTIKLEDYSKDMESECFPAVCEDVLIKQETTPILSLLKQPTIVLAARTTFPKVNIKVEPGVAAFPLPPTPPSCNGSDSEGSLSPVHAPRKIKPITPLISTQPKGATGVLQLTDEEKRTLLAEGYHIPQKLPLTKAEERSLKKIRRKIKNKISAQESRRKKKEYVDALEKKVEVLSSENSEYKKKLGALEGSNKSLLSQLQHLQAIIADMPTNKRCRNAASQTILPSSMSVRHGASTRSTDAFGNTEGKGR